MLLQILQRSFFCHLRGIKLALQEFMKSCARKYLKSNIDLNIHNFNPQSFYYRYGGLHCVAISGYAKGVDYFPGDRFQGLPANHSWNAVYLKGSWQLVDAQWATRYLSSGMDLHDNVVYEYDDFYFLMEPQQVYNTFSQFMIIFI